MLGFGTGFRRVPSEVVETMLDYGEDFSAQAASVRDDVIVCIDRRRRTSNRNNAPMFTCTVLKLGTIFNIDDLFTIFN